MILVFGLVGHAFDPDREEGRSGTEFTTVLSLQNVDILTEKRSHEDP